MTASPEPLTLAEMHARKRAADERQAEAARRHKQARLVEEARIARVRAEREREQERQRAEELTRMAEEERRCLDALVHRVLPPKTLEAAPKAVVYRIAKKHGLTRADLTGPSRKRPIVEVRMHAVAVVARRFPHLSLKQIGRHFGGRHHTTILSALRRYHGAGYSHRPHQGALR